MTSNNKSFLRQEKKLNYIHKFASALQGVYNMPNTNLKLQILIVR